MVPLPASAPSLRPEVVVVAADAPAAAADDVVITATSGATVTLADGWTYLTPGNIIGVAPANGQFGTAVVITGTTLFAGGTTIDSVTLAGVSVSSIDATQSETRIEVVAAASAATAAADVVMVSDIGTTVTGSNFWTYLTPGAVTGVEPSSGLVGTVVTISGSNLQGGGSEVVTVTLGGIGASISSENNTDVVVVAGASPAATGAVDVVLTANSGAVVTGTGAWSYTFSNITECEPEPTARSAWW